MDNVFVASQIDRLSRETDDLRKTTTAIEKNQTAIEASIKYLSHNIERLSAAIDKLTEAQTNSGLIAFFKKNWYRIPTIVLLMYGAVWLGNYINDRFIPDHKQYKNQSQVG